MYGNFLIREGSRGMNISDSIGSFSNLYKKGLIKKEQFEAKIIDIVKSDVSGGITLKAVEDYLLFFKKMLSNSQIDEKLYDEISDLLLAKCKVSDKPRETSEKKREIRETDSYTVVSPEAMANLRARAGNLSIPSKIEKPPELGETDSFIETQQRGFFGKLVDGDYGLAKTFWLFGVLGGFIIRILLFISHIRSIELLVQPERLSILILSLTTYYFPVFMGTWRAASKYQGKKIWAILAKIAVVNGVIILLVGLLGMLSLMGQA